MLERRTTAIELLTVAGFCAFLFYFGLAAFGLVGADEPRYAQIAREMLARQDLVTPLLYGHPWLEKPPLYYWRAMVAYRFFGVSDWAARLPSATAATVMVGVIYFFLRRFRPGAQLNGALMTAASAGVIGFARGAGTDILLAASFTIGMLAWFAWYAGGRRLWLAFFYLFMGLGTLAKGPVAPFLAAVMIVVFALVQRGGRLILRTLWWPGILLLVAVALPWFIAVQLQNPQFGREFILQHNFERFATNRYHHRQPFWYFVPVLLAGALPWAALTVAGWVETIRSWKKAHAERDSTLPVFLVLWTAVVLVFFSLSESKLPGYILPAVPACTILAADWAARRERLGWVVVIVQGVLSGGLLAGALLYPSLLAFRHGTMPVTARWIAIGTGVVVLVATVAALAAKGSAALRLVVLTPVILGLAFLLRPGAPALDNALSARPVAREIGQMESRPVPLSVFKVSRETEYGLAFYRNQPIPRYERGEIPAQDNLVVTPDGFEDELRKLVRPRRVSRLGTFAPQRLAFFWVSTPPPMTMEHHHE